MTCQQKVSKVFPVRVNEMHNPESFGPRSRRISCFFFAATITFSLLVILSYVVYASMLHPGNSPRTAHTNTTPVIHQSPTKSSIAQNSKNTQSINTCLTRPHTPGDSNISITSDGLKRTFIVHLASSYGIQPQPLVINYHGYSFTAAKMESYSQMNREADKAGFILVFPQGLDQPPSWNAGIGAYGPTGDANDIQFTRDMLSYLKTDYCVDAHRIYVTGFSLGGSMAYRVACTLSDQVAALATVAGAFYQAPAGCHPSRPLPILEIHGQADKFAPYNGNPTAMMAAVSTYLNGWFLRDHCSSSSQVIFHQGDVTGLAWKHCAKSVIVEHYTVSDGGHTWPGAATSSTLGYTTNVIDANAVIWNFFRQFST
jgi:polyhydroxybutyrate depolymerase